MAPRDPHEPHRVATSLELFLDLAFVAAIAQAAASLDHSLVDRHFTDAVFGFTIGFFAIWWAWMNITWFGSAYDSRDVPYRLATFVEMTGVLILAAGIPRAVGDRDFAAVVVGYVVLRAAAVGQWLRVAASDAGSRPPALRYAAGVALVQLGWIAWLAVPEAWFAPCLVMLVLAELLVPVWAERAGATPWHPHHIVERYGLFTLLVLGESVLAATVATQAALDGDATFPDLATTIVGGLLIVFSMWWIYFDMPADRLVELAREQFDTRLRTAFAWGYGHYFVFSSVAAVGAGLSVVVAQLTGEAELTDRGAGLAVTIPVAIFVTAVWLIHRPAKDPGLCRSILPPLAVAAVLLSSLTGEAVLLTGLALAALVATNVALTTGPAEVPAESLR